MSTSSASRHLKIINYSSFNCKTIGLSGRPHPVLSGVLTTQEAVKCRVHAKMLAGDYPCQYHIGRDRNQDTSCQLCKHLVSPHLPTPSEDMVHILATCRATSDTRERILPDLLNAISIHMPTNPILELQNSEQLTQLVLDPTSPSHELMNKQ